MNKNEEPSSEARLLEMFHLDPFHPDNPSQASGLPILSAYSDYRTYFGSFCEDGCEQIICWKCSNKDCESFFYSNSSITRFMDRLDKWLVHTCP